MAFENRLQNPNSGTSKVVVFLSICLLIVTVNTVIEHQKKLDIPSIATAEVKQQVAEITRGFESDLKASLAQVTSLKQELNQQMSSFREEINQSLVTSKNSQDKTLAETQAQLKALTNEVAATEKVPQPFIINEATPDLLFDTIKIHGVQFEFAARKQENLKDLHGHIQREINGFAILKDAIEQSTRQPPLVMDVGANNGLLSLFGTNYGMFSLFAAKLGADVIVVEPQEEQCRVILTAAKKNGVEDRITVYHSAVSEKHEIVTLKTTEQGQVATEGNPGEIEIQVKAFPIYQFLLRGDTRRVAFLKIAAEGIDLHAIQSAVFLFAQKRVSNVLLEWGPPDSQTGLKALKDLHDQYGMEPRIIEGWEYNAWPHFIAELGMKSETAPAKAEKNKFFRLRTDDDKTLLMDSMETITEESFLWLVPDKRKAEYPVFESDCSNTRGGDKVAGPDGAMLTSFGCTIKMADTDTAE